MHIFCIQFTFHLVLAECSTESRAGEIRWQIANFHGLSWFAFPTLIPAKSGCPGHTIRVTLGTNLAHSGRKQRPRPPWDAEALMSVTPSRRRRPVLPLSLLFGHYIMSDSLRPQARRTPGLPVPHLLPKFAQVHVHCIGEAIQPLSLYNCYSFLPSQ